MRLRSKKIPISPRNYPHEMPPVAHGMSLCGRFSLIALLLLSGLFLTSCATRDRDHQIVISVADQRMVLLEKDVPAATWPVSTSKFGLGDRPGSNATPLGRMEIAAKIGENAPSGAVFHNRRWTGEIVPPNAPGRDPIVSRILWLKGLEPQNSRAYARTIYIHGTPEESKSGEPASYGCIRMKSSDVIALFDRVGRGAEVVITTAHLPPLPAVAQNIPTGTAGE